MRDADWYNRFFFCRLKNVVNMKRVILSFVCICLVASLFAQTESVKGGISKHNISAYHAIGVDNALSPSLEAYTYPQREKKQPNDWWFGGYITTYFGMSYLFENGRHLWFGFGPSVEYIKYYTGFTNFKFEIQF